MRREVELPHLIITSVADALSPIMKLGYKLTEGREIKKPEGDDFIWWKDFLRQGENVTDYRCHKGRRCSRRNTLQRRHHRHHEGHKPVKPQL